MNIEKQHYVPRAYLKFFTENSKGHFFRAGPKPEFLSNVKPKHISEVCYVSDFYKINKEETLKKYSIEDKNFIEKKAFEYEKKAIRQVINKLKQRPAYINKSYHEQLVDIILSIKHRNIFYRQNFTKLSIDNLLKNKIEQLKIYKDEIELKFGEPFSLFVDKIKSQISDDLELHEEFHKQGIIEAVNGTNEALNDAKKLLMGLSLSILEPVNTHDYFITSDNPGFTLLGNKVLNTNYGEFDYIGFPINSKQLLLFRGKAAQGDLIIHKQLNHRWITSNEILIHNYCTIFNSYQYVFCESKKYLKNIVDQFENDIRSSKVCFKTPS